MGTAKTTSKVFDKGPLSTASSFFQEVDEDHVAETSWPKIAYIIVANFLGAGVLQCGNQPVRQAGLEVLFIILAASMQHESAWRPRTRRLRLIHPNV